MNLGEATIVLRHRPALELVDLTLRFVRGVAPKAFLKLGAVFLPAAWIALVSLRQAGVPWAFVWLLALGVARVVELPYVVLCGRLLFEPEVSIVDVLRQSQKALVRFAFGSLLYAMLMSASLVLIVGPLFVGANYFFLPEVLVLERAGPFHAFKRSHQFLGGRSGTGVEGLVLRWGLFLSFVVLSETLGQAVLTHVLSIHVPVESLWEDGGSALALMGMFLFVPYGAAYRFLAYTNERTRQDGWDIQVAFLRLAARASTAPKKGDRSVS